MDLKAAGGSTQRRLWVGGVEPSSAGAVLPFGGEAFALLVVAFAETSPADKYRVARALIDQGCRYAVCAGVECEDWEDVFDHADLDTNPDSDDDRFVVTTSHPGASLAEVAEFFFSCTAFDGAPPARFAVVTVGAAESDSAAVTAEMRRVGATFPEGERPLLS